MSTRRFGFTLIEVALFLAITGLLFVGIAVGTQNSIFQQRFNDAVQNFAEFLRSAYSEVSNVRNEGKGRSDMAIYGKLITFGEDADLAGHGSNEGFLTGSAAFSYNVIAKADTEGVGSGDLLQTLADLDANVVVDDGDGYKAAGFAYDYKPRWSSAIQNTDDKNSFVGALLIVRHPDSGTIYTYVMKGKTIQVNLAVNNPTNSELNPLMPFLENSNDFKIESVDFCINPNGLDQGGLRRDVRIVKDARNGSGVEIIGDGVDDQCKRLD